MAVKWGTLPWGNFLWSEEGLDKKNGLKTVDRVIIKLDSGDVDVSSYYEGGAYIDMEKELAPDSITAGDVTLTFNNYNNYFTDRDPTSLFYGEKYHNREVVFYQGLKTDAGVTAWIKQFTMRISSVKLEHNSSKCFISCSDLLKRIVDFKINTRSSTIVPVADAGNTGDGTIDKINTLPFIMVTEDWTLTCNLGGGSGVATFTVVGSVSGNIGTATSNTEFYMTVVGGIKFTINAGSVDWVIGDKFTFSTIKYPEWDDTNPGKIIWGMLTGYNYDTDAPEDWLGVTLQLDHTKSIANTDIDYTSFTESIANIDYNLSGFVRYDTTLSEAIENVLVLVLGSLYIDANGKIVFSVYQPTLGSGGLQSIADTDQNIHITYDKDINDIINSATIKYKASKTWEWSDESPTTNGVYVNTSTESQTNYEIVKPWEVESYYYTEGGTAAKWVADRIIDIYSNPPEKIEVTTGFAGITLFLGNIVRLTDTKLNLSSSLKEVTSVKKDFSTNPKQIIVELTNTNTDNYPWCFLGSSAVEYDHDWTDPDSQSYDTSDSFEKQFCYLSKTGGSGGTGPDYYLF